MPSKPTIPRACEQCGATFLARLAEINRGGGRYCSNRCVGLRIHGSSSGAGVEIDADGLTARVPLRARDGSIRAYATIDAADAEWVDRWRWNLLRGSYAARNGWDSADQRRIQIYLHKEVLAIPPGDDREGDHINRDKLDCRRSNLRPATHAQNRQNTPSQSGSTSPYRGVSWASKERRWTVRIYVNGKSLNLGSFDDELEAATVAREARARLMPWAVD